MIEYIDLTIDFAKRNDRLNGITLDRVTTRSYDTAIKFRIEIIGHALDETYDVKILTKYHKSDFKILTTLGERLEIVDGKLIYTPRVNLITEADYVLNYLYLSKDGLGLDMAQFNYEVDVSQIGDVAVEVKQVYDESYETLLAEFEQALEGYKLTLPQADSVRAEIDVVLNNFGVDSQQVIGDLVEVSATAEIAEQARKEAEILREESYEQKVDLAIVEADVVEKVDNKVTELTPQINNLTAQLADKVGGGKKAELEDLSADVLGAIDGSGGPFELTSIPQDNSVTLDKILNPDLLTGYIVSEASQGLPFSGEGNYSVELEGKGNIYISNGNMIDLFGLTDGTYTSSGITVTINGNEITATGTATANSYFKLSEGSAFQVNNSGLEKPLDNLPLMDSFCWSLYDKTNVGDDFTTSIRSTVSGNYQGINTTEINSYDNMSDTTLVGQLYMFFLSGQTINANFKIMFGYGTRDTSKETTPNSLVYNDLKRARLTSHGTLLSTKSGTIRPLIKLTDMIAPTETKASGVYVESHTDFFYFYIKGSNNDSNKYLRYTFEYWNGESYNNGKGWVLGLVDAVEIIDGIINVLHPVVKAGEWEMAIRLKDRPDFIGCKQHGSEVSFYNKFYVDGTLWTPNNSSFWCDEIKVIEKLTMYDPADEITVVGTHRKHYSITRERINIKQKIEWSKDLVMGNNNVYTAMLPMIRGNDATTPHQITSKAYEDATYEEIDVSNASHSARTARHEPNKWTLYSNSTGISASIESKNKEKLAGANSFVQNSASYNKVYFNYCEPGHTVAIGDIWENEINYELNINL